jgi:hypothetical protein
MANVTFRKNAKTGNWDVFGPASLVLAGSFCSVSRADGTIRRIYVESVCRSFQVNGTPYVYGVIGKAPAKAAPTPAHFGAPVQGSYHQDIARQENEAESYDADDSSFNVF